MQFCGLLRAPAIFGCLEGSTRSKSVAADPGRPAGIMIYDCFLAKAEDKVSNHECSTSESTSASTSASTSQSYSNSNNAATAATAPFLSLSRSHWLFFFPSRTQALLTLHVPAYGAHFVRVVFCLQLFVQVFCACTGLLTHAFFAEAVLLLCVGFYA